MKWFQFLSVKKDLKYLKAFLIAQHMESMPKFATKKKNSFLFSPQRKCAALGSIQIFNVFDISLGIHSLP